jgi:hypothetical protein
MRTALSAVVLLFTSPVLANEFPVVGGYGFDWLKPQTTKCQRITRADAKEFSSCTFSPSGYAFGHPSSYHTCKAAGRSEYLIYASQAKCAKAFETMEGNAP